MGGSTSSPVGRFGYFDRFSEGLARAKEPDLYDKKLVNLHKTNDQGSEGSSYRFPSVTTVEIKQCFVQVKKEIALCIASRLLSWQDDLRYSKREA